MSPSAMSLNSALPSIRVISRILIYYQAFHAALPATA
jgi:hypothetical protein